MLLVLTILSLLAAIVYPKISQHQKYGTALPRKVQLEGN